MGKRFTNRLDGNQRRASLYHHHAGKHCTFRFLCRARRGCNRHGNDNDGADLAGRLDRRWICFYPTPGVVHWLVPVHSGVRFNRSVPDNRKPDEERNCSDVRCSRVFQAGSGLVVHSIHRTADVCSDNRPGHLLHPIHPCSAERKSKGRVILHRGRPGFFVLLDRRRRGRSNCPGI